MTWCSLSAKDGAAAVLGRRHWDVAEQSVPAPHFGTSDFNDGRSQGILDIILRIAEDTDLYQGRMLDPACGSGGMFVTKDKKDHCAELSVPGVEKCDVTVRLCRLNFSVHGLEGEIKHSGEINSSYDESQGGVPQIASRNQATGS